jgi:hypothetical protein
MAEPAQTLLGPPGTLTSDLVLQALRTIDIAQLLVGAGSIGSVRVNNVEFGEATIERLVLGGLSAGVHAGNAFLQNVRMVLELKLSVDWWYDIRIWDDSGTESLGSLAFAFSVGNVLVPSLRDIDLSVPLVTATGTRAHVMPVDNLDLGGSDFSDVRANRIKLPSAGFGLSGLDIGALTLSSVGIPGATTQSVSLAEFKPRAPLTLPGVEVTELRVPSTQIPQAVSTGAVNINDVQASRRGVSLNLGVLGFTFWVQPIIDIHIETLTLGNVSLSLGIDRLRLENVSAPVILKGINLGNVELQQVTVNQISI